MNDILSGITEILDDPAAAAKIGEIAKSLSSAEKPAETAPTVKEETTPTLST